MDLHVSRETVFNLLSNNTFLIPEYQREYAWDEEQCSIFWEDLIQFYNENKGKEHDYFLGTIVCYKKAEDEEDTGKALKVIDGQQRITTLILLLKALYRTLERMKTNCSEEDKEKIQGQQRTIESRLWQVDGITKKPSFDQPRITTRVYTNPEYNTHLQKVLSDCDLKKDDNFDTQYRYVQNYMFFIKKIDELSFDELGIEGDLFEFIRCLEESCVLLPITCKDFEMGLKIFQTLNDRGMPLSDADIFKQQLYTNYRSEEERRRFNTKWSEINDICNDGNIKIVDIFKYYMHIIRAEQKKTDNMKALRPFYLKDNKDYLSENKNTLMRDIEHQAILWSAIYNEFPPNNDYAVRFENVDKDTKKYLQILLRSLYPNEWSENMVAVLWRKYDGKKLNPLLRKIIAALYFLFIKHRTVVSIKPKAYVMNNNIYHDRNILEKVFQPQEITEEAITKLITNFIEERTDGKIVKGLLALYAYLNKHQEYVPKINRYQIEHILPKRWQDTNYNRWTQEDAKQYFESIGNKVFIERKLNIQAGNGYFNNKKQQYKKSKIHELRSLAANQEKQDWLPDDIQEREKKMTQTFIKFFLDEFSH